MNGLVRSNKANKRRYLRIRNFGCPTPGKFCILRRHPTTKKLFAFLLSRQFAKEAKQQAFNYIPRRQILLDQLFFLLCIFKY